jgi:hypothetical protein
MAIEINGKTYRSKKHPILEYIFQKYFDSATPERNIVFYLSDISEGYRAVGLSEPVSISNTILDLCRKNGGVSARLPNSISALGFDLKKKTGPDEDGRKYAGEFVYVGKGNELNSWLKWSNTPEELTINSSSLPTLVKELIRKDEAGLFSVIDYLDILSRVLGRPLFRIQNPMKWQPNEVDGFYASTNGGQIYVYPVEAKALTTKDEINLDQMEGGFKTVLSKMKEHNHSVYVQQIAVRMIKNGIDIAIFSENLAPVQPDRYIRVKFEPVIENWK